MSLTSNVPSIEFTPEGIVVPTTAAILAGEQADINAAFGGNVNPSLSTPQGALAQSATAIIADKDADIAYVTNQVDPQYASGRFQDAIGRIYYLTRQGATATLVTAPLIGVQGTVIPAETIAKGSSGNFYALTADVEIGASPTEGVWANTVPGATPADSSLAIYQALPSGGWDSIGAIVTDDTVVGSNVQSRADFEFTRKNSVAINGQGTPQAIQGAVFQVPGVTDCYVIDNKTDDTVEIGATNFPLLPHSVYVGVTGNFDPQAVADAINVKINGGCDTNGNTSKTVDDNVNYNYPYPEYPIKFEICTPTPVLISVAIINNPLLPANIVALVQAAVIARFQGTDSVGTRERIGALVFAARYYDAVSGVAANVFPSLIQVGLTSMSMASTLLMGIDQAPTITADNIAVTLI
jgi:hypothetical protein